MHIVLFLHFHYVATHRGITEASRRIPWPVHRDTVSDDMQELERLYGQGPLFERRPFRLTAAGSELADEIKPLVEKLERLAKEARLTNYPPLRVGASSLIHTWYMPDIVDALRKSIPNFRLRMRNGADSVLHDLLRYGEADLVIAPVDSGHAAEVCYRRLGAVPLTLIVPDRHPVREAKELWIRETINEPLIVCDYAQAVRKSFDAGLARMGKRWEPTFHADNIGAITAWVAAGNGIGVTLDVPPCTGAAGVRTVALPGFDPIELGAFYSNSANKLVALLVQVLTHRANAVLQGQKFGTTRVIKIDRVGKPSTPPS
jgi:DNA-binding transcriptional LysR family regulator